MKMKRYLAVFAACAVVFSGCGSSGTAGPQDEAATEADTKTDTGTDAETDTETATEKPSLYERGLRMIERMDTMAGSDTYIGAMTSSSEVLDILDAINSGDYTKPKAVFEVKITDPETLEIALAYGGSIDKLPEELKPEFRHRLVAAVPSMMSSFNGASSLAAISLIRSEDFFLDEEVEGEILYLYIYDGSYGASVLFSARGEGIVSAAGQFICNNGLEKILGEEDLMEWLKAYAGEAKIEITTILME